MRYYVVYNDEKIVSVSDSAPKELQPREKITALELPSGQAGYIKESYMVFEGKLVQKPRAIIQTDRLEIKADGLDKATVSFRVVSEDLPLPPSLPLVISLLDGEELGPWTDSVGLVDGQGKYTFATEMPGQYEFTIGDENITYLHRCVWARA